MTKHESDSDLPEGTAENTNSASSQAGGDKQSSFDATKLQSTLEALSKKLDEVDKRSAALQGDKDRGVNKANSEVEALKKKIAELEKYRKAGYDDDSALEEMSFRETIHEVKSQLAELKSVSAGNGAVDVAKVVSDFGLSKDDPAVVAFLASRSFESVEKAEVAIAKFVKGQTNKPIPSEADRSASPTGVSKPTNPVDIDNRIVELSRNYSLNRAEIERLVKQRKDLGD
jgi:hypothetical protein